jgi:type I restriction enzyme, S subunit
MERAASWQRQPLRMGVRLISGHHVLAKSCNVKGIGIPYLTGPADFPDGAISHSKYTDVPTSLCKDHDILVTVKGSGSGTLVMADGIYCISRQLMAIRVEEWDPRFIYYSLKQSNSKLQAASVGLIPGLSRSDILDYEIAIPPAPEQWAIAAALSDVDTLIDTLEKLITKKRSVKLAILQQIFGGRLRLPGFTDKWACQRLGDACRSISDGTHFTPHYVDTGIPFYSVENVTADNFSDPKFITPDEHTELVKRCRPERGDILLTRIGELGATKLLDWDVNASIYVSLALLKVRSTVDARYLYLYTKTKRFIEDLEARSLINASPKKINMGAIASVPVPLPALPEQRAIASLFYGMDAEIVTLEHRRDKTKGVKQGMMQQLLTGRTRLL